MPRIDFDSIPKKMAQARQGYSMLEKKKIVEYIIESAVFTEFKAKTYWVQMADSKKFSRTWQSLKEVFLKRIYPDITNPYYKLTNAQIKLIQNGYNKIGLDFSQNLRNKSKSDYWNRPSTSRDAFNYTSDSSTSEEELNTQNFNSHISTRGSSLNKTSSPKNVPADTAKSSTKYVESDSSVSSVNSNTTMFQNSNVNLENGIAKSSTPDKNEKQRNSIRIVNLKRDSSGRFLTRDSPTKNKQNNLDHSKQKTPEKNSSPAKPILRNKQNDLDKTCSNSSDKTEKHHSSTKIADLKKNSPGRLLKSTVLGDSPLKNKQNNLNLLKQNTPEKNSSPAKPTLQNEQNHENFEKNSSTIKPTFQSKQNHVSISNQKSPEKSPSHVRSIFQSKQNHLNVKSPEKNPTPRKPVFQSEPIACSSTDPVVSQSDKYIQLKCTTIDGIAQPMFALYNGELHPLYAENNNTKYRCLIKNDQSQTLQNNTNSEDDAPTQINKMKEKIYSLLQMDITSERKQEAIDSDILTSNFDKYFKNVPPYQEGPIAHHTNFTRKVTIPPNRVIFDFPNDAMELKYYKDIARYLERGCTGIKPRKEFYTSRLTEVELRKHRKYAHLFNSDGNLIADPKPETHLKDIFRKDFLSQDRVQTQTKLLMKEIEELEDLDKEVNNGNAGTSESVLKIKYLIERKRSEALYKLLTEKNKNNVCFNTLMPIKDSAVTSPPASGSSSTDNVQEPVPNTKQALKRPLLKDSMKPSPKKQYNFKVSLHDKEKREDLSESFKLDTQNANRMLSIIEELAAKRKQTQLLKDNNAPSTSTALDKDIENLRQKEAEIFKSIENQSEESLSLSRSQMFSKSEIELAQSSQRTPSSKPYFVAVETNNKKTQSVISDMQKVFNNPKPTENGKKKPKIPRELNRLSIDMVPKKLKLKKLKRTSSSSPDSERITRARKEGRVLKRRSLTRSLRPRTEKDNNKSSNEVDKVAGIEIKTEDIEINDSDIFMFKTEIPVDSMDDFKTDSPRPSKAKTRTITNGEKPSTNPLKKLKTENQFPTTDPYTPCLDDVVPGIVQPTPGVRRSSVLNASRFTFLSPSIQNELSMDRIDGLESVLSVIFPKDDVTMREPEDMSLTKCLSDTQLEKIKSFSTSHSSESSEMFNIEDGFSNILTSDTSFEEKRNESQQI